MEEAKYLPTTTLSFFVIPQNFYVTTLDGRGEGGGGLISFDTLLLLLRGGGGQGGL